MECPDCEIEMEYEEVSEDCFSYKSGHYTREHKEFHCSNCDKWIDPRESQDDSDDRYEQKLDEKCEKMECENHEKE